MLVVLLGSHWLAQHYLAANGLRTYAEVVEFLRNPAAFAIETAFLIFVTPHALLGLRAILLDLGPRPALVRIFDRILWGLGLLTIAYGLQLFWQIIQH